MQAETELRDLITAQVPDDEPAVPDVQELAQAAGLDAGQTEAAAALASTDPLVIVEGAAGSGKTTMLATAITASSERGRLSRVATPTKKAADVAQHELGTPTASVAALVYAHGWRWNRDGVWTRLTPGDTDPDTGRTYTGVPKASRLAPGERVIVDEAGMLDQDTAIALFTICTEHGATIALVGDRAQLPAVGRGGVLDMAAQIRGRPIDMAEVHRFTDPAYAELSVRLRDRDDPGAIFDQLTTLDLIHLHVDAESLREHIAQHREDGEAVTVATNDEAARLNERIRDHRTHAGTVDEQATATGSDGLPVGRGDLIQTRKNDTNLGVANRQLWNVQHIENDGTVWAVEADSGRKREHTVRLPAAYVTEHAHLAYASTAYGVQGVTATGSHTILSDAMSGAAVYVGMTRGKHENQLHVVAESTADARAQFIDAVERDRADRGLTHATQQAAEAVRGLVDDGPVKRVNTEIAALTAQAERAERRAALWQQAADALAELHAQQRHERDNARQASVAAIQKLERVRAEAATPLIAQALGALAEWQDADTARQTARDRLRAVGRFGKRRATREHHTVTTLARAAEQRLTGAWGEPPRWNESSAAWVERVTRPRINADPRVTEAATQHEAAANAARKTLEPDDLPRLRVYARIFGTETVVKNRGFYLDARPHANAENQTRTAQHARDKIEALRTLTPAEAVERIEQTRTAEQTAREAAERALAERRRQLHHEPRTRETGRRNSGPTLG